MQLQRLHQRVSITVANEPFAGGGKGNLFRIQFTVVYQADGVMVLHRLDKGDYLYLQKMGF